MAADPLSIAIGATTSVIASHLVSGLLASWGHPADSLARYHAIATAEFARIAETCVRTGFLAENCRHLAALHDRALTYLQEGGKDKAHDIVNEMHSEWHATVETGFLERPDIDWRVKQEALKLFRCIAVLDLYVQDKVGNSRLFRRNADRYHGHLMKFLACFEEVNRTRVARRAFDTAEGNHLVDIGYLQYRDTGGYTYREDDASLVKFDELLQARDDKESPPPAYPLPTGDYGYGKLKIQLYLDMGRVSSSSLSRYSAPSPVFEHVSIPQKELDLIGLERQRTLEPALFNCMIEQAHRLTGAAAFPTFSYRFLEDDRGLVVGMYVLKKESCEFRSVPLHETVGSPEERFRKAHSYAIRDPAFGSALPTFCETGLHLIRAGAMTRVDVPSDKLLPITTLQSHFRAADAYVKKPELRATYGAAFPILSHRREGHEIVLIRKEDVEYREVPVVDLLRGFTWLRG